MLTTLHRGLSGKLAWYRRWHDHPHHHHVHWGALLAVGVVSVVSVAVHAQALASPSPTATQYIQQASLQATLESDSPPVTLRVTRNPECRTRDLRGNLGESQAELQVTVPEDRAGWALAVGGTEGSQTAWTTDSGERLSFNQPVENDPCEEVIGEPPSEGQLTVDPSHARVNERCERCSRQAVKLGAPVAFDDQQVDSVTIAQSRLYQAGRWGLSGISFQQRFPEHVDLSTIRLPLTLTLTAQ